MEAFQKNLFLRIISGSVGVVGFLFFLILGGLPFKLLIIVVATLGLIEYFNLVKNMGFRPFKLQTIIASIILTYFASNLNFIETTLIVFLILFLLFLLTIPIYYNSGRGMEDGAISIYGFLYLSIPSALLVNLRNMGLEYVLFVVFITWINDIFAFFIGKFFGKNKLAPTISPNKTWEGFIGGLVFCIIFAIAYAYIYKFPIVKYAIFSAILSITGTLGDLIESVIKREARVKDSGVFLIGHGGVLDRVDSLIVNIPVYFILISVFT